MDTQMIEQFFRELSCMTLLIAYAYFLVGGFIFVEERLKRAIIHSAKN